MVAKSIGIEIVVSKEENEILRKAYDILVDYQYNTNTEDKMALDKEIANYCDCENCVDTAIGVLEYITEYSKVT